MGETAKNTMLRFKGLLVIAGGGPADPLALKDLRQGGAALVAADGGARWCARAGIVPDAIIGDMDSLEDRAGWAEITRLIEISEQESTDFEKCLYLTQAPVTVALGVTGDRLDHTLAAVDCAARYGKSRHIILVDQTDLALIARGKFIFSLNPGARVSVHPVTPVRFKGSVGLEYPLAGIRLAPGERVGTSNRTARGRIEIEPEAADQNTPYLVIMAKMYLDALIEQLSRAVVC